MEETSAQEVQIPQLKLSEEDISRIKGCDIYGTYSRIMASKEAYKDFEVGTAIFIIRKSDSKMVSSDYEGKCPEKFIIVQNDDGFLFVKKINASGRLSVVINCVTTEWPSEYYELRVDDDYVESVLLDTQESYNPMADAQKLLSKKGKASRKNGKNRVLFPTAVLAYEFIKTLKKGDKIWQSDYSYGGGITEYEVDSIEIKPVSTTSSSYRYGGDSDYINNKFPNVIKVKMKSIVSTNQYSRDRELEFYHFSKENWGSSYFYYLTKPICPEDIL